MARKLDGEDLALAAMLEAVRELDAAEDLPFRRRRFLSRGSSLGGAHPKATTEYNGKPIDRQIRPRGRRAVGRNLGRTQQTVTPVFPSLPSP